MDGFDLLSSEGPEARKCGFINNCVPGAMGIGSYPKTSAASVVGVCINELIKDHLL